MSRLLVTVMAVAAILLVGAVVWLGQDEPAEVQASLALAEAMGGDTTGYARVLKPKPFSFPEDHGPHPAYKTEWWYYTGNLETAHGRHFGYQFTIFRIALAPPGHDSGTRASTWATDQLYMAHFTLTDVAGEQFRAFERFSRGAAGLAGAQAEPFRVWLEDWSVEQAGEMPRMHLEASADGVALDLTLDPLKPAVLQGDYGFDRKGPTPGDASYYYSFTRLATEGEVTVGGETHEVSGLSWMDREWSTSALGEGQVGWDWFSLQLSDGQDVMYYQIREEGGGVSPFSDGVVVGPEGGTQKLSRDDVHLQVLDRWESERGDAEYPSRWRLRIPGEGVDLEITPYVANQELDVAVRYWEGAVRISGTVDGKPIGGSGYVEMTGYDQPQRDSARAGAVASGEE